MDPIFVALKLLDVALWLVVSNDLVAFGVAEILTALQHIKQLLGDKFEYSIALLEWTDLKLHVSQHISHLVNDDFWATVTAHYQDHFKNIVQLYLCCVCCLCRMLLLSGFLAP